MFSLLRSSRVSLVMVEEAMKWGMLARNHDMRRHIKDFDTADRKALETQNKYLIDDADKILEAINFTGENTPNHLVENEWVKNPIEIAQRAQRDSSGPTGRRKMYVYRYRGHGYTSFRRYKEEWKIKADPVEVFQMNCFHGWIGTKSGDDLATQSSSACQISFRTVQEAMDYCKSNGWQPEVIPDYKASHVEQPAAYADNFPFAAEEEKDEYFEYGPDKEIETKRL